MSNFLYANYNKSLDNAYSMRYIMRRVRNAYHKIQ